MKYFAAQLRTDQSIYFGSLELKHQAQFIGNGICWFGSAGLLLLFDFRYFASRSLVSVKSFFLDSIDYCKVGFDFSI